MPKLYVNEENLGTEATREQALQVIKILQSQRWNVNYGDSLMNDHITDEDQANFDAAFYKALDKIAE